MPEKNNNKKWWVTVGISIIVLLFGSGLFTGIYWAGASNKEQEMNVKINRDSIQRLELSVSGLTLDNIATKGSFIRIEETLKNIIENQKETLYRLKRIENREE